ncbi:MAG: histidinol-phosphate transaminase [Candidatus Magnetoovum sp. WYHC-5]|nr:histidinol-phosphate transaminase [Candidatus Magnetoovum sp. WYHC-5]
MLKVPDYVKEIKPYVPGKPIEELERQYGIRDSIKLASNENPLGPSPVALQEVQLLLSKVHRYPDGSGYYLKTALAEHLGVRAHNIILGNGSNELIDIAVRTFVGMGQECVMADVTFPIFFISTKKNGGCPIIVPMEKMAHNLSAMADNITDNTKIVFIANPNNPTGTTVSAAEFDDFMEKVPEHVLVISDEAYFEYVMRADYPDTLKYIRQGRNVLILRTFSKIYGLAGFRIGYGVSNQYVIELMGKIVEPFNTNMLAQAAACAALKDKEHIRKTIALNEEGKAYLYAELEALHVDYIKTEGNFIYMDLKRDCHKVYEALLQRGIIVRPMGATAIRVTIGKDDENKRFVHELKEVLDRWI